MWSQYYMPIPSLLRDLGDFLDPSEGNPPLVIFPWPYSLLTIQPHSPFQ